ncbi:MAG TPA: DUF4129 domain-containing protein [Cellulomonas sp.]
MGSTTTQPQSSGTPRSTVPRAAPTVLGAVVLTVVVVLGSAVAGPWVITGRDTAWDLFPGQAFPTSTAEPLSNRSPAAVTSRAETSPVLAVAGRVLVALAVVTLVVLLVVLLVGLARRWRAAVERRAAEPEILTPGLDGAAFDDAHLPGLRAAVALAGRHLDDDVPPGDAVISAWVALERAAEQTGVRRDPAATPTEFTVAVLDATQVDPAAIRALLELYLAARFSEHPLTDEDVERARASLQTLATGLARRRAAADSAAPVTEP